MTTFLDRMFRAAKLDAQLYEEVEADPGTMRQAMGVVVLSSLAAGVGSIGPDTVGFGGILIGTLAALGGWYIWAYLAYFIGTKFLPEPQTEANFGQLLRTTGFSSSPGLIRVLAIIAGLRYSYTLNIFSGKDLIITGYNGLIIFAVASIWMLVAMVIAVRQALDYTSTWRAVAVCAIGWIIQTLIIALLLSFWATLEHL